MPEATRASGVFTGNADVSWDTTKEGLPQGKVTLSGRNVKVTQSSTTRRCRWRSIR